jgi:16S rRNA (uracil1498-N3)-methyltransferase
MRHQPHLLVDGPWEVSDLEVSAETTHHLSKVLRLPKGGLVTYTNGRGIQGNGTWTGSHIERGDEQNIERISPTVTLAVAPPKPKDRQRFIVEKSQELGVNRLVWLVTDHGEGRPVPDAKVSAWARGALEQSRGAWLMEIRSGVRIAELSDVVLLDAEAVVALSLLDPGPAITIAVGPEGGFSSVEIGSTATRASIPTNVLRTDTAAIVAVATVLAS